ncbi:MAG: F0F1 ATP synthase subunit gamma [Rhodospirillaceae bacterium]|jgi:F-type H+-transporting ATPase subunit gamma|nr:F0F1 ATP synthase subunit gamma [Rhodospirillaceae bacterium]MBT5243770.1 F0F1 ATP synthase subunit gamma [Rhodospirillaceae bacterium]MBT5563867.1 F0F1 ATP synthase subunit gamma [Rhodospirillaceae bacterium]MBT6241644.1 F0F1 ATP synthase subunit gamma [Rhodospirillaceae bacterium]MBT7138232.1 F0F1 ATP synthase subunit gamma [Rhodospirillaceae bacterium]
MANLKDLRIRINSVKSTRKITSAMKMVAASKLKRAQSAAEEGRPYAERMERMLGELTSSLSTMDGAPKLLSGSGADDTHLIVAITADRGLCGGFNGSIIREARRQVIDLQAQGKKVKILCLGRKGRDGLNRNFPNDIIDTLEGLTKTGVEYNMVSDVAVNLVERFEAEEFDICTIIYNRFVSAISQDVTVQQVIPFPVPEVDEQDAAADKSQNAMYLMEPSEEEILDELLPRNLSVQLFRALLESNASEHGARMSAMDNATRNAGDMLDDLTMTYNRTRQAVITSELIEIISGAEAL